jgi:hypothetical protein
MFEALPGIAVQVFMALIHGGVTVSGLAILKAIRNWPMVLLLSFGMSILSISLTAVSFLLQGWPQASEFLLPGGQFFLFHTLPLIIGTLLTNILVMCAAYALFVEPGNREHV